MSERPFDDIRKLIAEAPTPDATAAAQARMATAGAGRLADLAAWLAAWTGRSRPSINRPIVAVYAAAQEGHEGGERGRMEVIAAGGALVSRLAGAQGAGLEAFDLAVDRPSPDIRRQAAMSERECAATMAFGMEVLAKQPDLLIVSSVNAGAALSAAALAQALFGGEGAEAEPRAAAARALEQGGDDPLELLRQLGGRDVAAIAGAILAARTQKAPVLLDGLAAAAAAAVLHAVDPRALDHCRAADASPAPGHAAILARLGLEPLLDLGLLDGEGAGGVAALGLLRAACAAAQPGL